MRFQVRLTAKVEQDIDRVLAWFAEQRAIAAGSKWLARLIGAIDAHERNPLRCAVAEESAEVGVEVRELRVGRRGGVYRVLFRIDGQLVHVLHVRHGSRDRFRSDDLA